MSNGTNTPLVRLEAGQPMASSLVVARSFGKNHYDVLRDIRNLMGDLPAEFNARNFAAVEYPDAKGEMRPSYQLTRDAFTLLAMGFTGKRALAWKLKYIAAFNAMEAEIMRLRQGPAELSARMARLERRQIELERAAELGAEYVLLSRLRTEAVRVLGPEMAAANTCLAARSYPNDEKARLRFEGSLNQVQIEARLRPRRPRRSRKTA